MYVDAEFASKPSDYAASSNQFSSFPTLTSIIFDPPPKYNVFFFLIITVGSANVEEQWQVCLMYSGFCNILKSSMDFSHLLRFFLFHVPISVKI